jgi:hypothetical protein
MLLTVLKVKINREFKKRIVNELQRIASETAETGKKKLGVMS